MGDDKKITPKEFQLVIDSWLGKVYPEPAKKKIEPEYDNCYHTWRRYEGLIKVVEYCLSCGKERKIDNGLESGEWNHDGSDSW
jgi:hypothetical protein